MKDPVFIDSNIWLYAFLNQDQEKRKAAQKTIKNAAKKSVFVSVQIINEVCFNLKKNDFPESEIKEIVSSFYRDFHVIDLSEEIMLSASEFREKYSISFWDSMVISAAISKNCAILFSEDMQHDQLIEERLRILNPFK